MPVTTLRTAIIAIQAHAITAGAKEAPSDPPENNAGFPFSLCYPSDGTIMVESYGSRRDVLNLFLDYHVARQNLALNVQKALDFYERFPTLLINDLTLGGTVDTIVFEEGKLKWVFGGMEYGGLATIGYRFTIPVKMRRTTLAP